MPSDIEWRRESSTMGSRSSHSILFFHNFAPKIKTIGDDVMWEASIARLFRLESGHILVFFQKSAIVSLRCFFLVFVYMELLLHQKCNLFFRNEWLRLHVADGSDGWKSVFGSQNVRAKVNDYIFVTTWQEEKNEKHNSCVGALRWFTFDLLYGSVEQPCLPFLIFCLVELVQSRRRCMRNSWFHVCSHIRPWTCRLGDSNQPYDVSIWWNFVFILFL